MTPTSPRPLIGLKQIAASLGLDVLTVSRALSGDPRVKPETTKLVRDRAKEQGYRPNLAARSLRGGNTNRVAVLLSPPQPKFASPIFLELLSTLDQHLRLLDISLTVIAARSRAEEVGLVRAIVGDRQADALVLGRTRTDDPRRALSAGRGLSLCHLRPYPVARPAPMGRGRLPLCRSASGRGFGPT